MSRVDDCLKRRTDPRMSRGDSNHFERRNDPRNSKLNRYFVQGQGINREVLQQEICRYLGPEAYARPSLFIGVDGYEIRAVRPFTREMLNELKEFSKDYEIMAKRRRDRGYATSSYEDFEATRREETAFAKSGLSPGSLNTRDSQSRGYGPSQENAYGYRNPHSSDYGAVYGIAQDITSSRDSFKSQSTGSILCSSCEKQARRGCSITLCSACRLKIAPMIESCDKTPSSYDSAVAMLASLLVGVVAGGFMGAEMAARSIVGSLRR